MLLKTAFQALILIALTTTGNATASQSQPPSSAAPQAAVTPEPSIELPAELQRVLTDYEKAWAARDAKALAALFTEDGYVLTNGRPLAKGRAAIEARLTGQGGPLALRPLAFAVEGRVGYIIGAFASKPGEPDRGKFTLTLRRSEGGRWLIVSDMDNGNGQRQ
jgi:ketosteroid isomerase-like protein